MNQVYALTNLALLTPQNLVENIHLENYLEIKYYKSDKEIICEMITADENEEVKYVYCFSRNNQLQRAFALCGSESIELSGLTYDFNMDYDIDIKPIAKSEEHFQKWVSAYPFYSNVEKVGVRLFHAA